jgi:hypothetical protein
MHTGPEARLPGWNVALLPFCYVNWVNSVPSGLSFLFCLPVWIMRGPIPRVIGKIELNVVFRIKY